MEESIAAAQDKLYSEAEWRTGVSDIETHSKGVSATESGVETSTKEAERDNREESFSKNNVETVTDGRPVATVDPYGSINEKVQGVEKVMADPEVDEGAEEEEEPVAPH